MSINWCKQPQFRPSFNANDCKIRQTWFSIWYHFIEIYQFAIIGSNIITDLNNVHFTDLDTQLYKSAREIFTKRILFSWFQLIHLERRFSYWKSMDLNFNLFNAYFFIFFFSIKAWIGLLSKRETFYYKINKIVESQENILHVATCHDDLWHPLSNL